MARPRCRACGSKTTKPREGQPDRKGLCSSCFKLSQLNAYHDGKAEAFVRDLSRKGHNSLEYMLTAIRKVMRPPPGTGEWRLHHVAELSTRHVWRYVS
jgi:hypothetical protein